MPFIGSVAPCGGNCNLYAQRRGGTIWNALRFALRIISGNIIYNFAILENLRIFQNCLFTGGVVTVNGICDDAKGTVAPDGVQQSLKKP